jgi:S1-C subfamily serine protease
MEHPHDELWQGGPWEQPAQMPAGVLTIPNTPAGSPKRRRSAQRRWAAFAGMLVLICGLAGLTVWLRSDRLSADTPSSESSYSAAAEQSSRASGALPQAATGSGVTVDISPQTEEALTYTQVYEKNQQSMVTIYVMDQEGMGQGAGIVLTQDGYIITNAHVVQDAQEAMVVLSNKMSYPASLVGSCESEDLAVLKIEAQGLTPAEFGDSNLLRVGDSVSALGNPLGYSLTLTPGIISALDRQVKVDGNTMYLLQTSAPINFGNSGGALLNDRGQVVGVTTVKIVTQDGSAEALGFAIPTERVKYVVDQLIAGEEIRTPVLGITAVDDPTVDGLVVREIQPWSDAGDKGLQVGDVIVGVNGAKVSVYRDLQRVKDLQKVGDELLLQVERDGQLLEISVRLADQAEHE